MHGPLRARDLVKVYGDRRVLDGVGLTVAPGSRVGLVGENGVGKSTLLRILAGRSPPTPAPSSARGTPDCSPRSCRFPQRRPCRRCSTTRWPRSGARCAASTSWVPASTATCRRSASTASCWSGRRRTTRGTPTGARRWCSPAWACGSPRTAGSAPSPAASGPGWPWPRCWSGARPALLLDEPTNHLDDEAVAFVERHLRGMPGVVLLASHDRVFLDEVCTDIVDLDPSRAGVTGYGGAYSDYLAAKRSERARWEHQYASEQDELAALRHAVAVTARHVAPGRGPRDGDKMGYDFLGGRVQKQLSRRVRNAAHRLDELGERQVRKPPAPLRFRAAVTAGDGVGIAARGLRVPGRLAVDRVDLPTGGRLLVTGPNGAGKSTLLAVLAGQLAPHRGTVHRPRGLRIGVLEQEVEFADRRRSARSLYPPRPLRHSPTSVWSHRATSTGRWARSRWASDAGWRSRC